MPGKPECHAPAAAAPWSHGSGGPQCGDGRRIIAQPAKQRVVKFLNEVLNTKDFPLTVLDRPIESEMLVLPIAAKVVTLPLLHRVPRLFL